MKRVIASILMIVLAAELLMPFAHGFKESIIATENSFELEEIAEPLASGLIFNYSLDIAREGSTKLIIEAGTVCDNVVIKCGFKNLIVKRRANSSSSWATFYDYGNLYVSGNVSNILKELTVEPGYQYCVTCKHYAKKNLFSTQTISNTSNIVTF